MYNGFSKVNNNFKKPTNFLDNLLWCNVGVEGEI